MDVLEVSEPVNVSETNVEVASPHAPSAATPPPLPIEAFESAELDLEALQEAVARANAAKAAVEASNAVAPAQPARRASAKRRASAVRVHVNEQGRLAAGQTIAGTLTDISVSGAFLASERTLKPGTEVTLRFSLPLDEGRSGAVEVRAEVRHRGRNQSGVGLRFLRMPSDGMRVIEAYLAEHRA